MNETLANTLKYIKETVDFALAEVSLVLFILGIVLILIGLFLFLGSLYISVMGQRVDGVVIGAINEVRIKEKERDGKIEKERDECLYLIYEYIDADGSTQQVKSSSGGSSVLNYTTGQKVTLIIYCHKGVDDVYDAKDKSPFIIGGILFGTGAILTFMAANLYASLSVSLLALFGIAVSMVLRGKSTKTNSRVPHNQYDPNEIRPIEEFVREAKLKKKT